MSRLLLVIALALLLPGFASAQNVDPSVYKNLNAELGQSYAKGDYDKALAAASKLVELTTRQYGKTSMEAAVALRNRGMVETAKGDDKHAEDTFENAIDIYQKRADLDKHDMATLAEMLEELGTIKAKVNTDWTEPLFTEALKLREKSNGPDAPETATPLAHLANIKFWQRKYKESAALYARALKNLASSPKSSKQDITFVFYRTACTYLKAGMETEFAPLNSLYRPTAEFDVTVAKTPRFIHAGVINGKAIHLEKPKWTEESRRVPNREGNVDVEVLIGETGKVISACGTKSKVHVSLVEAAEVAAYKSTFSPTTLKGNPVKVSGVITYQYRY